MAAPRVTIVVVQRERFSLTRRSLESLYEHTKPPFALVYVDAGSPPRTRRYLEAQSREKGFRLLRSDRYLPPNRARNLGLRHVDTEYVVFVDNDVVVSPGWLDALLACAEETGASLVGPVYLIGEPEREIIHMAGGLARIEERDGRRHLREKHRFAGRRLAHVRAELRREPSELIEFHCMLARRRVLERLGPLDEGLLSSPEHVDLCLAVREAGGTVFLAPAAVVTYVTTPRVALSDMPFFLLRWSDAWNRASLGHLRAKWRLSEDDPFTRDHYRWLTNHRLIVLEPLPRWIRRLVGPSRGAWVKRAVLGRMEGAVNRLLVPERRWRAGSAPARGDG